MKKCKTFHMPTVCNHSYRLQSSEIDMKDYYVQVLAEEANKDFDYSYIVQAIRDRIDTKEIRKDSEAMKMVGQWDELGIIKTEKGELVVRFGNEILIPRQCREELLNKLHSGHRGTDAMILATRSKFWWPRIKEEIKEKYHQCEPCLVNAPSKPELLYNHGVPDDLTLLSPNEVVSLDFLDIYKTPILVVKCHQSGFVWARVTKNKEAKTAVKTFQEYFHTFDRPVLVISDGGPAFGPEFTKYLELHHIRHHKTSAHHPSSNGDAEAGVKSVKTVLIKIGKVNQQLTTEACFNFNNMPAPSGQGTPAERFFRRGIRSILPNSYKKNLRADDMVQLRQWKREKLARRRGRTSKDVFKVNDPVRVQNPANKKWDIKGTVEEVRTHPNGEASSYVVRKNNGRRTIRHYSHIRHDVTADNKSEPSRITFQEEPSAKYIPRVIMTRQRARQLSRRALPERGVLKIRENSEEESDSDSDTSSQ